MNEGTLEAIIKNYEECYNESTVAEIEQYIVDRVGDFTPEYCDIINDVTMACLFFSGHKGYSMGALQLLMNMGSFYHGDMAKKVYEYVLSFSILPFSAFPPTYEEFRREAEKFGVKILD